MELVSNEATFREFAPEQRVFGRYTLKKILGRGGMGVVWLARDEELERDVALKFLPDLVVLDKTLISELKRETRRSLELTHKNIVRIYDFVQSENSACISMEYIDGDTLSNLRAEKEQKVFQPDELAAWTSHLCEALDYAHQEARIIHRDLKPANLMVNQKGALKVSDFGIARRLGDSMSQLTMAKGTSGTLVYMSPQQLDGERGTNLDDVYSLGATLYDLLTGKPPFYSGNVDKQVHERTAPSLTERRKEFNLEPALVPPLWEAAVAACLAKDPAQRPQSAGEFAERLQLSPRRSTTVVSAPPSKRRALWIGLAACGLLALAGLYFAKSKPAVRPAAVAPVTPSPAAAIPEKSIAVLPFENLSAEKDDAFFADGIQDDVLTSLGKVKDLTVIARASVLPYRGEAVAGKLREIGQTLRVAHILQGSVRRLANRVVVNVQLIDARNDRQMWTERYERTITDALSLQGELAVEIARELRANLTPQEQRGFASKPTENPDAYVLYLRARELETRFLPEDADLQAAAKLYEQAIVLDPKFALARARLSLVAYSLCSTPESRLRDLAQAEEALRLNPNLGEGHLALAFCYFETDKIEPALAELARAEELLPNSPEVWQLRATIYLRQGKLRERIAALQHAETLDPRDILNGRLAHTHENLRQWPEAIRIFERVRALVPGHPGPERAIARVEFRRSGVPEALKKKVTQIPAGTQPDLPGELNMARYQIAMLERDYPAAERFLREIPAEALPAENVLAHSKLMNEALLAVARGANATAIENALLAARKETEKLPADPADEAFAPSKYGELGLIDAFRGRKEDAIREGRRWLELEKESTLEKNDAAANLALIYARTGELDEAIKLIERLLTLPANLGLIRDSSMTQADLKWRWVWDPLRSDPRFQKILEGPEPKTIY
ncbi:MAG: protein kinase domain-containing protein [Chthoniobacterales bacterium]